MKLKDFPKFVGRLERKSGDKEGRRFIAVNYALNTNADNSKKYYPIRSNVYRVEETGRDHYMVHINANPFEEAHSVNGVIAILTRAFDRECIRAGIVASSPRTQSPPERMPGRLRRG